MQTVISAFDDRELAQRAVDRLVELGFDRDDLHIQSGRETRTDTDTSAAAGGDDDGFFHRVARFFADLFGGDDTDDSGRYAEAVRRGSTVLIVDARDDAQAERARSALEELGGHIDLDERSAQWEREGWSPSASERPRAAPGETVEVESTRMPRVANAAMEDDASAHSRMGASDAARHASGANDAALEESVLPVVQEEMKIGKREVQRGGVRVIQRMTQTPVRELLRLREERAVVERHPVDRPATPADFQAFREGTIELRETVEEPVVSKTAHVVEEVVVGKRVEERTQTVEDVVRRAAVEVEPLGQGASERMLERTGGEPTAPVQGAAASASPQSADETVRGEAERVDPAVDPEIVERSR